MSAQSLAPLRLIQFRAGYNLPVHIARDMGFFAKHGLQVEVSYTPGSVYLIEGLKTGRFDIAHTAADDVIADVESTGSDLFLFMGIYGGLLSLVGSPETREIESLREKTLGVDARSSGFVFVLEKMLRSRGLTSRDYGLVEAGGMENRYRGLLEGKFFATLLTPPYTDNALGAGCQLLLEAREVVPIYQATCGAARRTWARENAHKLARYIRAYVKATRWCFDPRNRKACLELLSKYNGIGIPPAEKTLDALLDPERGFQPDAQLNGAGVKAVLDLRAEFGYLAEPIPSPEKYLDLSHYRMAMSERPK